MLILFISCTSTNDISWAETDGYIIIQLSDINLQAETYYAEITLESGRRIAVILGLPDQEGKLRVKNNFGDFTDIKLYTNLDLE